MRIHTLLVGAAVAMACAAPVAAQQPKRPTRAGQTIVIRGQVPTPQVVTVRPRQAPDYDRGTLGSAPESAASFWPALLPGYDVVTERTVAGPTPLDSVPGAVARRRATAADSALARAREIRAIQNELEVRRARLDSLDRALRGEDTTAVRRAPPRPSAADSAARAQEIQAIQQELDRRRARLDSLQGVVRSLGAPAAKRDTSGTPPDSTRRPR